MSANIKVLETSYYLMNTPYVPYQVDVTDGTLIYKRWFSGDGFGLIVRTTIVGSVTTNEFCARAKWANRATSNYIPLYGE